MSREELPLRKPDDLDATQLPLPRLPEVLLLLLLLLRAGYRNQWRWASADLPCVYCAGRLTRNLRRNAACALQLYTCVLLSVCFLASFFAEAKKEVAEGEMISSVARLQLALRLRKMILEFLRLFWISGSGNLCHAALRYIINDRQK